MDCFNDSQLVSNQIKRTFNCSGHEISNLLKRSLIWQISFSRWIFFFVRPSTTIKTKSKLCENRKMANAEKLKKKRKKHGKREIDCHVLSFSSKWFTFPKTNICVCIEKTSRSRHICTVHTVHNKNYLIQHSVQRWMENNKFAKWHGQRRWRLARQLSEKR